MRRSQIVAGEMIELKMGLMFGISTMGAAALGNLTSDIVGLCVSGGIEAGAQKIGIEEPTLSSAQRQLRVIKRACLAVPSPPHYTPHYTSRHRGAHAEQCAASTARHQACVPRRLTTRARGLS
jgi:hypothetical protein